jgi:hypothetical protein
MITIEHWLFLLKFATDDSYYSNMTYGLLFLTALLQKLLFMIHTYCSADCWNLNTPRSVSASNSFETFEQIFR